uniref:Alkyl transferase n=1 Tax=Neurospora crassa TaxID=5141 RepID=Q8WZU6_NEUCS|nr:probable cis-prenyltransferase [Neurospora crassa]
MSDLYLSRIRNWFLSSPPAEWAIRGLRETLIGALKQGPVPRHVAFVMDGNRRYARSHKIETIEGHHLGFEALARVLEICYKCGVEVVTVYAFSIENFNRPKYEVDGLMQLAKVKLEQLIQHGELLERYGASVRVLGERDLLSDDVLEVIDRAVSTTKNNKKCILNICFPYTSREEMTTAIRSTDGSNHVTIYPNVENITTETIDKHMYTADCPPLDIFVRTSGVERLSDFMLWQCHQDTQMFFLKCFWPEFDLRHFLPVLLEWQWRQKKKAMEEGPRQRVKAA